MRDASQRHHPAAVPSRRHGGSTAPAGTRQVRSTCVRPASGTTPGGAGSPPILWGDPGARLQKGRGGQWAGGRMSDAQAQQTPEFDLAELPPGEGGALMSFTALAWTTLMELWQAEDNPELRLHAAILGRGPKGFQYDLRFVEPDEMGADDPGFRRGDLWIHLDAASANDLQGSTLDHVEGWGGGFRFENPNPLWSDPIAARIQGVLDARINPGIASHGGHVTLIDASEVEDGVKAVVRMGGGCQGCGMAAVTLRQGVETMLRDEVPELVEIIDETDHEAGANPYYASGTTGTSPAASD